VHYANYHYDLLGCIGIGQDLAYIDQDKDIDITSSRKSMRELMELIEGDAIEIEIK
jgi:phosphorylcholine metabolism protein LicD